MKRFFFTIWAGLVAFFSWIVRISVALICGRMVRDTDIAEELGAANVAPPPAVAPLAIPQFLEPGLAEEGTWLDRVKFLLLYYYDAHKLVIDLPTQADESTFSNLSALIFLKDRDHSIDCILSHVEKSCGTKHILVIVPVLGLVDHSRPKIRWLNHCAQNVARVTLKVGEKTRNFLPGEDVSIFLPEKQVAA